MVLISKHCKSNSIYDAANNKWYSTSLIFVACIEHKAILGHTKIPLEKQCIAINPKFDKLITSLRTAVED
jgi:hypothetical protein